MGRKEQLDQKQIAAIRRSQSIAQSLIDSGYADIIVKRYLDGESLEILAQDYIPSMPLSDRVAITVISTIIGVALEPEVRRQVANRHILQAYDGETVEEKKKSFGKKSAERRGKTLVDEEELRLLRDALEDPVNFNSPRHPGSPNYNQIAAQMAESTGISRPTSTLRRIAMWFKQSESRTHKGDVERRKARLQK